MEGIRELVLVVGLVFLSAYSMKVSQEAMQTMDKLNHQIQMMFVKS